jgi:hypothetical protein
MEVLRDNLSGGHGRSVVMDAGHVAVVQRTTGHQLVHHLHLQLMQRPRLSLVAFLALEPILPPQILQQPPCLSFLPKDRILLLPQLATAIAIALQ